MSYSPNPLLTQILEDSYEAGYVRPPYGWQEGHYFHHREMRPAGSNCWICCIPCCGRIDDELAVLMGVVFFVFSAFVAGNYALNSAQSAYQAGRDLDEISYLRTYAQPGAAYAYVAPNQQVYQDAETLLAGRRTERTWAAISQSLICGGAALVTVAILATIAVNGSFLFYDYGYTGVALVLAGGVLYAGTKCCLPRYQAQQAANRIAGYLVQSQN